jgi:hypothetical protein
MYAVEYQYRFAYRPLFDEILSDYPRLKHEDIQATIAHFAHQGQGLWETGISSEKSLGGHHFNVFCFGKESC